jgi:hypothetical protein
MLCINRFVLQTVSQYAFIYYFVQFVQDLGVDIGLLKLSLKK